jgi:uncharacterized membrane protein YphA (DoxX/SURF4 family)
MFKDNPHLAALGRLLIAAIFLLGGVGKIASPALTLGYIKMGDCRFRLWPTSSPSLSN